MRLDALFLPRFALPGELAGKAVGVFDVLRATTTMTVALSRGVREIRIFDDLEAARVSRQAEGRGFLVGEVRAKRPADFDLGNSPVEMASTNLPLSEQILFMSTTNGTRAIVAAHEAAMIIPAALVNADAAAKVLVGSGLDVTMLCSGTDGRVSLEDVIGAGAVLKSIIQRSGGAEMTDAAEIALRTFEEAGGRLREALGGSQGGQNVKAAGLEPDIDFAARLNAYNVVGTVERGPLRVLRTIGKR